MRAQLDPKMIHQTGRFPKGLSFAGGAVAPKCFSVLFLCGNRESPGGGGGGGAGALPL